MELYSVIENDGPGNVLIWKCMKEDFNNHTQLIVAENEEALFIKDGIIVAILGKGKHTLNTRNYPFIKELRMAFTGWKSQFTCKIYFVNKTHKMEMFWGLETPIQMKDPEYNFKVSVRSHGGYFIQVKDSKKLLNQLVGNNVQSFTAEEISCAFRSAFNSHIKAYLAKYMEKRKKTVLEIQTDLIDISQELKLQLADVFFEYGVELIGFYIEDISIPEDDANYALINEAHAKVGRMSVYGKNYERLTAENMLENMSKNNFSGNGMMVGGIPTTLVQHAFAPMNDSNQSNVSSRREDRRRTSRYVPQGDNSSICVCHSCGVTNRENSKYCSECGEKLMGKVMTKCANCGAEMIETAHFCSECGTRR